jgi:hypothetical protein
MLILCWRRVAPSRRDGVDERLRGSKPWVWLACMIEISSGPLLSENSIYKQEYPSCKKKVEG